MEVVDQLSAYLGRPYAAPGAEIRFDCCFCESRGKGADTKGHLYLNADKKLFWCHKCEAKGTLDRLLQQFHITVTPTAKDWGDIIRRLSLFVGHNYEEDYDAEEEIEYPCAVFPVPTMTMAKRYLRNRGLGMDFAGFYRMCVGAPGTRWESRLFIPTYFNNKLTFWVARTIEDEEPKYLNPSGRSRRYHLFNYDRALRYRDVVITEGVFSSIAAGPNAVATFGKYVTKEQLHLLLAGNWATYYVALDADAREQAMTVADWLSTRGRNVRIVSLPPGHDPDSVGDFTSRLAEAEVYGFSSRVSFLFGSGN